MINIYLNSSRTCNGYTINTNNIKNAIDNAQKGINQYLEIMGMLNNCNVAADKSFQKKFNAFYRVRQRSPEWYKTFYELMESYKSREVCFNSILNELYVSLNRYEPSFSSKLVATIAQDMPIWDAFVLKNCGLIPPSYSGKNKLEKAIKTYADLQKWYIDFLQTDNAKNIINIFDEQVSTHNQISDLKKIDFVLWQIR